MDGDLLSVVLCATQHERRASSYYFPPATWQPAPSTSAASSTSFFDRVPPHVELPPPSSPCLMQQQQYCPVEAGLPSLVKQEYLLPFATNYNISANLKRKGDQLAKTKPVSKRRKSEQKRIVRVQSDEQAPPDEWAWRKYGQKPIKGSPHPRSYYKCSSCKGCPARKQVERCPTDPGLLILAYTFHHNHPAPKRVTNLHFISHQHCDRTTTTTADSCASPSTAALKEEPTSTETTQANLVEHAQTEKSPSVALISSAGILNDFGEDVFGFLEDLDVDLLGATWEDYNEDEYENEYENEELKRIIRGPCSSASFLDNLFPWSSTCPPLAPSSSSTN